MIVAEVLAAKAVETHLPPRIPFFAAVAEVLAAKAVETDTLPLIPDTLDVAEVLAAKAVETLYPGFRSTIAVGSRRGISR